jgi:hypothetical protein
MPTTARPLSKPSLQIRHGSHRHMQEAIVHVPCFHGRFLPQYMRYRNGAYVGKPEFQRCELIQAIHEGTHNHPMEGQGQDNEAHMGTTLC